MKSAPLPPRPRGAWLMLVGTGIVATAQAHPGHSLAEASPGHLLSSPDHIALLALAAFLPVYIARQIPHPVARRWLDATGVVVALATAAMWTLGQ